MEPPLENRKHTRDDQWVHRPGLEGRESSEHDRIRLQLRTPMVVSIFEVTWATFSYYL